MGNALWPTRRSDGTVVVAARFHAAHGDVCDAVVDCIRRWGAKKADLGVDIAADLAVPPQAEKLDRSIIEVVFESTTGSRLWKDWLVDLTRDLTETVDGLRFEGFVDRVSGAIRPA